MTVETLHLQQEQEASPEFKNLEEFGKWLQDEAFRYGERSIYVDISDDPSLEKHKKTMDRIGLEPEPGLNVQENNEIAEILKADGVEMGIQDTLSLFYENGWYKGVELATFNGRTAWMRLTDEAGGKYELLFDGYLDGGTYKEGKLMNNYPNKWSDYAGFSKGGISYVTNEGTPLEHRTVFDIASRYDKEAREHGLELANGLRAALEMKLLILVPDFETRDLSEFPSSEKRSDVLR